MSTLEILEQAFTLTFPLLQGEIGQLYEIYGDLACYQHEELLYWTRDENQQVIFKSNYLE